MELAGRIFDVVTRESNLRHLTPTMRDRIEEDWQRKVSGSAICASPHCATTSGICRSPMRERNYCRLLAHT